MAGKVAVTVITVYDLEAEAETDGLAVVGIGGRDGRRKKKKRCMAQSNRDAS